MAKIKQGILGGFSGKVANVVGTSWKGRAVMKSQPLSVSNPRTEAQQEQRGKFSDISKLASTILTQFVQPVENPISGNVSGYNLFCKDNKNAYDGAGNLVVANLVCGGGKLENLGAPIQIECEEGFQTLIKWVNAAGTSAIRLTDKVYAVVIAKDGDYILVTSGAQTRNNGSAQLVKIVGTDEPAPSDSVYVLYAVVSADGRDVSVKTPAFETEMVQG